MDKKRILMCTEFSELPTGYSVYSKQVLSRLNQYPEFQIAELACYVSANDPRITGIPWKVYPNKPIPGTPEHEEYKKSPISEFGEYSFNSVLLDFKPDFVFDIRDFWMLAFESNSPFRNFYNWCFTKETPVLCSDGQYKNISDLIIGDEILDGNYNKTLIKNISTRITNSTIRLKTSAYSIPINTTKEHVFFAIKNSGRVWSNRKKRYFKNKEFYDNTKAVELEANFLSVGDMLVFPPIKVNINYKLDYSNELAILAGYFLSEGTCDEYGHIRFCLHKDELEYAQEIKNALKNVYPLNNIEERFIKDKNALIIGINNKDAVKNIWSKFYDDNGYKIMPSWVFNSPIEFIKVVIKSMWRGDGCVVQNIHGYNGLEYFTNSKSLSLSLWQSLLRLGIVANVIERNHNGHIGYRFFVYGYNAHKLNEIVDKINTISQTKFINWGKIEKDRAWIDKDGWLIIKITDKKEIFKKENVYDIEVESDSHTFLIPYKVHNCIMPTVDAEPQNVEWVDAYAQADAVFTYSEFGRDTLQKQCNDIKFIDIASPCASDIFKPIENKDEHRNKFNLDPKLYIIGTVMRNQRRKMYPDLFKGFREYLNKTNRNDVFLYCHTSYPDIGWDIPSLIMEYGLSGKILFTYKCKKCNKLSADFFSDAVKFCNNCKSFGNIMAGLNNAISEEELSQIYNLFDIYIQYANSEGFGMPQLEAAQCGNVVCSVNYSAMESVIKNIEGFPIKVSNFYVEAETGCKRAIPDCDDFVNLLEFLTLLSKESLKAKGLKIYENTKKHYNWGSTAKKWADYFVNTKTKNIQETWLSPPRILNSAVINNNIHSPIDQANYLVNHVLCKPEWIGKQVWRRLVKDLTYKSTVESLGSFYFNESHNSDAMKSKPFTFEDAYNSMKTMRDYYNIWEKHRGAHL